ncbi:MAG: beta-ketoacyl-[acyl-carrier-protein] synthase family protein [bacterium]
MIERRRRDRRVENKRINFRDRRRFDRRMNINEFQNKIFSSRIRKNPDETRIVITGIGVVAPNGIGKDIFWDNLAKGLSGIKPISLFDTGPYNSKKAGEITSFDPSRYLNKKGLRTLDRSALLLGVATKLAMEDSKIKQDEFDSYDSGIVTGTSMGSVKSISDFDKTALVEGPSCVNPALFPNTVISSPASQVSIMFDIRGLNATISSGFCSSLDVVIYAHDSIILNKVNTIFVGSVEELCHQTFLGFYNSGCLSRGDFSNGSIEESMPFDKRRNGPVLGEGSGALIFEDLEHAKKRNAPIYGVLLGFGCAFNNRNSHQEGNNLDADAPVHAMKQALKSANLNPADIDLICASSNSSPAGDRMETIAIKKVFANEAYKIPITAVKSMLGEGYSVSGSFQIMAGLLAINKGIIPPTINFRETDPKCDLDYVINKSKRAEVDNVMINTFSPHGNNVSLIIGRHDCL